MNQKGIALIFVAILASGCNMERMSLDLAVADTGLGFGNSARLNGIRLNLADDQVEEVNGLNVTLWWPGRNPEFVQRGIAVGLFQTDSRETVGLSLAPLVGGVDLYGINAGLLAVSAPGIVRGVNLAPFYAWGGEELTGINASLIVSGGDTIQGLTLAPICITPLPVTDLLEPHDGWLQGISASGIVIDYPGALGLVAAGLVRVRHLRGLSLGYVLNDVRGDAQGLCVAPFNFATSLSGVQIGLLNHVASNPHPFKWLPGLNIGFGDPDTD